MSLSLDDLLAEGKKVYVRNKTDPRGIIVITVTSTSGRSEPLIIPKTLLPINLSERLPPSMLRDSPDLRKYIVKGTLQLIPTEVAEQELSSDEAQEELRYATAEAERPGSQRNRVHKSSKQEVNPSSANKPFDPINPNLSSDIPEGHVKLSDGRVIALKNAETGQKVEGFDIETESEGDRNSRAVYLVEAVISGDMGVREALMEIKTIADQLSDADLSYVISRAPDGQVRNWAKQELANQSSFAEATA